MVFLAILVAAGGGMGGMAVPPELQGANAWGGRRPHLAVVNSVLAEPSAEVLSLRGTWEFGVRDRNAPGLFHESMMPKGLFGPSAIAVKSRA